MPRLLIDAIGPVTGDLDMEKFVIYGPSREAVMSELIDWLTAHGGRPCDLKCYFRDATNSPEDAYQCVVVYDAVPTEDTP